MEVNEDEQEIGCIRNAASMSSKMTLVKEGDVQTLYYSSKR
jgi:hypothetical protein